MAITAQYVSEDNVLETSLLALVEVFGAHEGENLAPYILKVVEEWDLLQIWVILLWTMHLTMIL